MMVSPAHAGTVLDPVGDTFRAGAVQHDITSVSTAVGGGNVQFTFNFAAAISAPSVLAGNNVVGFIDLDTDQNPVTGAVPITNVFSPAPPVVMGDEFFVDVGFETANPGSVGIFDAISSALVGTVPIAFGATSFSLSIPLALLGGDDGLMNFAAIFGSFLEPTDRIPNGATPLSTAAVPTPATLLLLTSAVVGVGTVRVWNSRPRMTRIKWREVFKFVSGATFAGALANFYLWVTGVSVPLFGGTMPPTLLGVRAILSLGLSILFFYLGWLRRP
jgi:hypothetical protein